MSNLVIRPCPFCGGMGNRRRLHEQKFLESPLGDGYDISVCSVCGGGFSDSIPSCEVYERYYSDQSKYVYSGAAQESPFDLERFERIADQLVSMVPSLEARILDVGCATGGLLGVLRKRGYRNLLGSDPSSQCAQIARTLHNVEVRVATIADHRGWEERFDLVIAVGVLEHLVDLRTSVRILVGLLKPGGIFYFAQPDVENFWQTKNAPFQQFSFEHVNFFSRYSIQTLMASINMQQTKTWQWMIQWRAGVTDSVLSTIFSPAVEKFQTTSCLVTAPSLSDYVNRSDRDLKSISLKIDSLVFGGQPIFVWGAGSFTRTLLAKTALGLANIVAFVDANPHSRYKSLSGHKVIAPLDLRSSDNPILIASFAFGSEIEESIRKLRLTNPIIKLNGGVQ